MRSFLCVCVFFCCCFVCDVINDLQIPQTFHFIWSWHTKRMTTNKGIRTCVCVVERGKLKPNFKTVQTHYAAVFRRDLPKTIHMPIPVNFCSMCCSIAIVKWFWVIYFIVALKYLLFWKALNNAVINLTNLQLLPLPNAWVEQVAH